MADIKVWTDRSCQACGLAEGRTQIVVATPCKAGGILAVGEAPGAEEDVRGEGFVGMAGKTLDRLFSEQGMGRFDYGRANICRCRPPENRKPSKAEIASCSPFLADLIRAVRPGVILAVGGTPTAIFCGAGPLSGKIAEREADGDWSARRGRDMARADIREALEFVGFVVPMPHTSPLAFNRNSPGGEKWAHVAKRQVALAVELSGRAAGN